MVRLHCPYYALVAPAPRLSSPCVHRVSVWRFTGRQLTVHPCAFWALSRYAYVLVSGHPPSLPRGVDAGPIRPLLVGHCLGLRLKNQWVQAWSRSMCCAHTTHRSAGVGGCSCHLLEVVLTIIRTCWSPPLPSAPGWWWGKGLTIILQHLHPTARRSLGFTWPDCPPPPPRV